MGLADDHARGEAAVAVAQMPSPATAPSAAIAVTSSRLTLSLTTPMVARAGAHGNHPWWILATPPAPDRIRSRSRVPGECPGTPCNPQPGSAPAPALTA